MHDSFTPLGAMVPLANIMLSEVVFGGVGAGLYGILIFIVLSGNQLGTFTLPASLTNQRRSPAPSKLKATIPLKKGARREGSTRAGKAEATRHG